MPNVYPSHVFGMHDRGGEQLMLGKNKPGWVLLTEAIGADPNNHSGNDYTDLSNQGLGVIVRLNYGYGSAGTIPFASQYDDFSRRCGNYVEASPGCHIWIIGNEMNLSYERPGNSGNQGGEVIIPQRYASCYAKCRAEIRRRTGHGEDQVVVGAVGPYNIQTTYPENPTGDFQKFLADILALLTEVDGVSLHAYTHGQDPNLVFSDVKMQDARVKHLHNEFRVYRDFMAAIPERFRTCPVYITEADQYGAWKDANTGWVRNAYQEINTNWNQNPANQPIQALILYRWIIADHNSAQEVGWAIEDKPALQADWRDAMNNDYRVVLPLSRPLYLVTWLEAAAPTRVDPGVEAKFPVTARNDGRATWANTGSKAVQLGQRWIDAAGAAVEGPRTPLPQVVPPDSTVQVPQVAVRGPAKPGFYTLELDLVEGASVWFAGQGSPAKRVENVQVGARYRTAWLSVAAPPAGTVGETVGFPVRLRNDGALTWEPAGSNPFTLTYRWLDANRNVIVENGLRTMLPRVVAPGEEIALDAQVQLPAQQGQLILQMDMVHEFITWFQWKGSPTHETQVNVSPALPDYAAEWLEYVGPPRLITGEKAMALVQVKNTGTQPWPDSGLQAVTLGYRWLDGQGNVVSAHPTAKKLSQALAPGATVTLRDVPLAPISTPGTYRLVWDLVQGGNWLSASGVAVMEAMVQVTAAPYSIEWLVLKPWPAWMLPGEEERASLRLRNTGTVTWSAQGSHPVHLAYHWFSTDGQLVEPWDTFRALLPNDVSPGASVDLLDIALSTPGVPGDYILRWDLVEEGVTWFFRQGAAPLEVAVEISDQAQFIAWTAQASHKPADVALAFDGNPDTAWDSGADQQPGMWFLLDLGQAWVVDRVRVTSPGRGFPVAYSVKVSENGQDWRLVAASDKNWRDIDASFSPCSARYIRLEQTGTPQWVTTWTISEIAVALADPWTGAEASHFTADSGRAIDARLDTAWNTRNVLQKPGMWFKLDMGSLRMIERVVLQHPKNQQPRGYVVQVSGDGQSWQEVGRKDDNWAAVDVTFPAAAARYVRVETTNSSPYQPWGIAEFIAWESSPRWLRGHR